MQLKTKPHYTHNMPEGNIRFGNSTPFFNDSQTYLIAPAQVSRCRRLLSAASPFPRTGPAPETPTVLIESRASIPFRLTETVILVKHFSKKVARMHKMW